MLNAYRSTKNMPRSRLTPPRTLTSLTLSLSTVHSLARSLAGRAADLDLLHLDRGDGVVVVRGHGADLHEQLVVLGDLGEDGVLAGRRRVKPVEVGVVGDVEEDLRAAAVRLAGVGHGDRARDVGVLRDQLVLDVAAVAAGLITTSHQVFEGAVLGTSGAPGGCWGPWQRGSRTGPPM